MTYYKIETNDSKYTLTEIHPDDNKFYDDSYFYNNMPDIDVVLIDHIPGFDTVITTNDKNYNIFSLFNTAEKYRYDFSIPSVCLYIVINYIMANKVKDDIYYDYLDIIIEMLETWKDDTITVLPIITDFIIKENNIKIDIDLLKSFIEGINLKIVDIKNKVKLYGIKIEDNTIQFKNSDGVLVTLDPINFNGLTEEMESKLWYSNDFFSGDSELIFIIDILMYCISKKHDKPIPKSCVYKDSKKFSIWRELSLPTRKH